MHKPDIIYRSKPKKQFKKKAIFNDVVYGSMQYVKIRAGHLEGTEETVRHGVKARLRQSCAKAPLRRSFQWKQKHQSLFFRTFIIILNRNHTIPRNQNQRFSQRVSRFHGICIIDDFIQIIWNAGQF